MKKILSGILGLALTLTVVGGVAYAAFTSTASVHGITIETASTGLTVGSHGGSLSDNFDAGLNLTGLVPGYGIDNSKFTSFDVSNGSTDSINLKLFGQLTHVDSGWGTGLENWVEVAVNNATDTAGTGYHTLADWNSTGFDFPGPAIAPGITTYKVYVRVPSDAPNSIQGKSMTNITFVITGTQTP